ncbi:MAG: hypothetical protein LBT51_10430 [Fusobacteriaceae bacterium]|jgi:putative hydroxymethylpyrimidine transporter CytX|nr:hypothetical protein [Fusobacteriaceae bacterium]
MKNKTMFLLWLGAAISVSEIFTGGLLAPLGIAKGIAIIVVGHLIGTGLLAFGAYVSYSRKMNAMDSVGFSLGKTGGKIVAVINLIQLIGWIIILVVQSGKVISVILPNIPFWSITLCLSVLQIVWAIIFGSPGSRMNDVAVILLSALCLSFFAEIYGYNQAPVVLTENVNIILGIELSIAMPVSWLPLVGDHSHKVDNKICATGMPFLGYFVGSTLMYILGLLITITSGKDIFDFIGSSKFKYIACGVVLLSTITTNFVALYSAAISSTQLTKYDSIQKKIIKVGMITLIFAVFFPVERFSLVLEKFLTSIDMIFVPIFTVIFLEFLSNKTRFEKTINWKLIIIAFAGMIGNLLFSKYNIFIPTIMSILLITVLFSVANYIGSKKLQK